MHRFHSGLFCLLTLLVVATKAQAVTTPLEPYLIWPIATPPIGVNFTYVPPSTAADYPTLRQGTGRMYTNGISDRSLNLSLIAYDDAHPGNDGAANVGSSTLFDTGLFASVPKPGMPYGNCNMPMIPLQGVSGASFPITRAVSYVIFSSLCAASTGQANTAVGYSVSYDAPSIVTVGDGNQIESVKVSAYADGVLWADYFYGYRIGLLRMAAAAWSAPIFQVPALSALTLPPPVVEGIIVEYSNTRDFPEAPGGHFFYSSDPAEQHVIDSGPLGHFQRTGRTFNAGGYVPVCRFYGSQTPGPNSHFFSADQSECAGLKALQRTPTPTDVPQWNSEGNGFYAVAAVTAANGTRSCLTGTVPVYRAYNNAFAKGGKRNAWDSNHRFSTSHADIDQLVANQGWTDEGIAFCAPN